MSGVLTNFYSFAPLDMRGKPFDLSQYQNKVVLVVNTASKCDLTPQFAGLESLYADTRESHPRGTDFEILGFPCNQFMGQEPGTAEEAEFYCQLNYGVSFKILDKIDVNGSDASPLFEWMKAEQPGTFGFKRVKWNFEKFLIGRDGLVKQRWAPPSAPEDLKVPVFVELEKTLEKMSQGACSVDREAVI